MTAQRRIAGRASEKDPNCRWPRSLSMPPVRERPYARFQRACIAATLVDTGLDGVSHVLRKRLPGTING